MVGWHHGLSGHEFEQVPGDTEGQGSLACCSPWGHKESDDLVTEQQAMCQAMYQIYKHVSYTSSINSPNNLKR